jgi:hypothetical protein
MNGEEEEDDDDDDDDCDIVCLLGLIIAGFV